VKDGAISITYPPPVMECVLVEILVDGQLCAAIAEPELPCERALDVSLADSGSEVVFRDRYGAQH